MDGADAPRAPQRRGAGGGRGGVPGGLGRAEVEGFMGREEETLDMSLEGRGTESVEDLGEGQVLLPGKGQGVEVAAGGGGGGRRGRRGRRRGGLGPVELPCLENSRSTDQSQDDMDGL